MQVNGRGQKKEEICVRAPPLAVLVCTLRRGLGLTVTDGRLRLDIAGVALPRSRNWLDAVT